MRSMVLATQEVRLAGLLDAMAYGCFPAFFSGKIAVLLDIWGEVPVAKEGRWYVVRVGGLL